MSTCNSPKHLPYFPTPYEHNSILLAPSNITFNLSLAAKPLAFSSKSLVLDSGVLIPANLILFLTWISNPNS